MIVRPLKAGPLKAAIASFMDVPVTSLRLEHQTGSLRKAVARAIHTYERETAPPMPRPLNDNEAASM